MALHDWKRLLTAWNKLVFSCELEDFIEPDVADKRWLGNTPATDAEIAVLESRLGLTLPPSYRAFLQFSNGWNGTEETPEVPILLPTNEVDRFSKLSPDALESWQIGIVNRISPEDYRTMASMPDQLFPMEFLENSIQIAEPVDNVYVLLIPDMIREQEFEVWSIAAWFNGPLPYPSFWQFMQKEYQDCVDNYSED